MESLEPSMTLVAATPFAALLLSLVIGPFWSRWSKDYPWIVAGCLGSSLVMMLDAWGFSLCTRHVLHTLLQEMIPFGLMITTLYALTSSMGLTLRYAATPLNNTVFLAVTSLSASLLGTTGAAMLVFPSLLQVLTQRRIRIHTIIFFIFLVCNIGGALTPLGDPPLLLGFLYGIPFSWPLLNLGGPFLVVWVGSLALYSALDRGAYIREGCPKMDIPVTLSLEGKKYAFLFIGVVVSLALSSLMPLGTLRWQGLDLSVSGLVRDLLLAGVAAYVAFQGDKKISWHPLKEIAIVFSGLFITAIPVLDLLGDATGPFSGLRDWMMPDNEPLPLRFFYVAGFLSGFLDNAPTYMTFFHLAGGDPIQMVTTYSATLQSLSCGAVFMGALTYIGNAPNMMVRALATEAGVAMPSFLSYLMWSLGILGPLLALTGWLFWAT